MSFKVDRNHVCKIFVRRPETTGYDRYLSCTHALVDWNAVWCTEMGICDGAGRVYSGDGTTGFLAEGEE